jgi:hypothetical protein
VVKFGASYTMQLGVPLRTNPSIKDEGTMNREALLERFGEPCPSDEVVQERPGLQDAQIVAYFLHVRARKPGGMTG